MFKIIVCVNSLGYIGVKNKLMNYLPSDLQHFKELTKNNVVIMGRKTFESLPKGALPNRVNIVLTTDNNFTAPNVIVVHSLRECIDLCKKDYGAMKWFVIGGGTLYKEFLEQNIVNEIYMTYSFDHKIGDTLFPLINEKEWTSQLIPRKYYDERDECDYIIKKYSYESSLG
jgi:dihydrofolate reductase